MIKDALDCTTGFLGSGLRNCVRTKWGDAMGFILFSGGVRFDNDNPLTEESYNELLKELKAFPYVNRFDFTDNTPENEINTSSLGLNQTVRQGFPLWQMVFTKGSCFHKSLYNKRNISWQIALVFSDGILLTDTVQGFSRGFNSSPLDVETYRVSSGTDLERSIVNIQLSNPDEFNARNVFYSWETLGFDINEINGVVDVNLDVEVISSTELHVAVHSACNGSDVILGLDDSTLWALTGTSETVSAVTYNADTEKYELTLSGSIDGEFTLKLSKGGFDVVEDLDGGLYKGATKFNTSAPSV